MDLSDRSCRLRLAPGWLPLLLALFIGTATAQTPRRNGPQVGYAYPAGLRAGTTTEVHIGGKGLQQVDSAWCSAEGVVVSVVSAVRPLSAADRDKLRAELEALKGSEEPGAAEKRTRLQEALAEPGRNQIPDAVSETVKLSITAAPDAPCGVHELRLISKGGVSAPLRFDVFDHAEHVSPFVAATTPRPAPGSARASEESMRVQRIGTLPCVVNGQILAGQEDRFRFVGRKGMRWIASVQARSLVPYLADAVPGWFQAVARLTGPDGREVAYADDFRHSPDPVLACILPEDGDYEMSIRDALFRGREDFVYRVIVGEVPFVSGVYPLGAAAGADAEFHLRGWNLPVATRRLSLEGDGGRVPLRLGPVGWTRGELSVEASDLPESVESPEVAATVVDVPCIVNGRIESPGDEDWLEVSTRAGQPLRLEVLARRLGSPVDACLHVLGPDGALLASADDVEDPCEGLVTHHADPVLDLTPAADGKLRIRISDTQHRGGPDFVYRLRIAPPAPDFGARVFPSGGSVRAGGKLKFQARVHRHARFAGPVGLRLVGAPAGWALQGNAVVDGEGPVEFELQIPRGQKPGVFTPRLEATGAGGVVHEVVPCEDRMQAFFYRHLVPATRWVIAVH
jgi:hypothetical protein